MRALADLQRHVRRALLTGEVDGLEPLLAGGCMARRRFAIHQRHYAASLITALLDRFPATVWLVGSACLSDAARRFVQCHPPSRPCLAEYGEVFPAFLAGQRVAADVPYLRQFAELEWHLGRLSLAIVLPHVGPADFCAFDAASLMDASLSLQPGLHYLHADWAINDLMMLHLADSAPDRFVLQPGDVWLELRGTRGDLWMNRLTHADFAFRGALAAGMSLGYAGLAALEIDPTFHAGHALLSLLGDELVTSIDAPRVDGAA